MPTGRWRHYPVAGGALAQPPWLLEAIRAAWRVWDILGRIAANAPPRSEDDDEYIKWVRSA